SGCWYHRTFDAPPLRDGQRLILRFGAVDYVATVWVNDTIVVRHEGGYTPFHVDITELLTGAGPQTLVVQVRDEPEDLAKPRGKQDWLREPHLIWYPRTTGIWQTVWLERVPPTWIDSLRWQANLERWELGVEVRLAGLKRDDVRVRVQLNVGARLLADDTYALLSGDVTRRIALSDPGIDDYRNDLLWQPARPTLIHAVIQLLDRTGDVIDAVQSYTALRSIGIEADRFILNGRPYTLRLVLDQGYWPETGLSAPSDAALRRDVELAKAMGFNGVRKHQKLADPRYLFWADSLGLLVWEEMPSAYRFISQAIHRLIREWSEAIERDYSHPCIVTRVPFNESSGVPDLHAIATQRHYVDALYHLTKTLDPERPVVGNDGWESASTDIIGIHDYDDDLDRLARRYGSEEAIPHLFKRFGLREHSITLEGYPHAGKPIVLSEFGGLGLASDGWSYTSCASAEELGLAYAKLLEVVRSLPLLAGFCYTQFADTYQEVNGLLYADRTPKVPLEEIARATRGPRAERAALLEHEAQERLTTGEHRAHQVLVHEQPR
ncbi:MAG: glycoside hydrolase family 2, partial [Chloroflexi bacterium]|nr:glycoside hydrolase family 2 [Chloroflexota bacterium]